jgi:cell division septation protein DedD
MTTHRNTKRKVWTGLVLVLLGASTVVAAPVGAGEESSGNLTCEAVVGELGLTDVVMAKDDVQRTAPYDGVATNGDFVVTYRFVAAPDGAPEAYVVSFSSADLVYGAFVKQAAEKQGLSRSAVFPDGTLTGSVHVPDGEFSHVSFCTGTVPTTEPPVTEPPVTEPPVTEPPVTEPPVTEPPVTEPPVTEPPVTEPPETPTTDVGGEVVVPTPEPEPEAEPEAEAVPEAEAAPAVLGDTVVRSLPRTGSTTVELGVVGVVMVLLGSALLALGGRDLRHHAAG